MSLNDRIFRLKTTSSFGRRIRLHCRLYLESQLHSVWWGVRIYSGALPLFPHVVLPCG